MYCVATYGVTGARDRLDGHGRRRSSPALRPHTDLPLLVGVGIGAPEQAAEVCGFADGVVVGSALMAASSAGTSTVPSRLASRVPQRDPG